MTESRILRSLNRLESRVLEETDLSPLYREDKSDDGLTIVIPNWNHRPYLPRAIRSALESLERLEERGFSGEILVIDDGSRDGSHKLLRSIRMLYQEPRLKTLFLRQNLGLPRVRNLGLRMSEHRYVCLMDADNELIPANLPLFFQSLIETDAALVYGNLLDKRGVDVVHLRSNMIVTMRRILLGNLVDAFSLVDAQRLLQLEGFVTDPQVHSLEDWEMVLHLIAEEEIIVFVPAVLGYYHVLPLSMIQETSTQKMGEAAALMQRVYAQSGKRKWDATRVVDVYHPAVGYIETG